METRSSYYEIQLWRQADNDSPDMHPSLQNIFQGWFKCVKNLR